MIAPFLPSVDIASFSQQQSKGLSANQVAYFRYAHAPLSAATIDSAFTYLQQTNGSFETCFDVTALDSTDDILSLLDSGAAYVFVSPAQLRQLQSADNVDASRLVLSVPAGSVSDAPTIAKASKTTLHISGVSNVATIQKTLASRNPHDVTTILSFQSSTFDELQTLAYETIKLGFVPVIPSDVLTADIGAPTDSPLLQDVSRKETERSQISAAALFLAGATTDRSDGLFTTLVADERGVALGMVYSSGWSISESIRLGRGVYQSRKRGLWYKGESSGDTQELVNMAFDCDSDCMLVTVRQEGRGFCHLGNATCFGQYKGLSKLQQTLQSRKNSAPAGSYTARLFNDPALLSAKIKEEAQELCEAESKKDVAWEAADLIYFALTKCIAAGVSLSDIETDLDLKNFKVKRRKGDAKPAFVQTNGTTNGNAEKSDLVKEAASVPKSKEDPAGLSADGRIRMNRYVTASVEPAVIAEVLKRPSQRSTDAIMGIVKPIIEDVRTGGDKVLLSYTHKFEKATSLKSPVLHAPYPEHLRQLDPETIKAIDISYANIEKFHAAQKEEKPLSVATMPGVVCSRFSRAIERVGLYVPGGTAVLPSTALMLGVPAKVAGCKKIILASPPRTDGSLTPEIVYVAHKIGAESIVLAGGAQAVAAMAYGTESISKVDKILGPGNQFVTAGKMLVSNDTSAGVSIDMPAGPSEVLVVADATSNPAFVASDLLSQAEHGVDSQVILIAVALSEQQLQAIEDELHKQAMALPRVDIVRGAIEHSVTLVVRDMDEAMALSNQYAPEHLILQTADAEDAAAKVENAGSVFIGPWTPESVGDYSAGVNHSLPTYGYARQYSGVNLGSYLKHITSSRLTADGLKNVGPAVMQLAKVEELEAHRRAVSIRLEHMAKSAAATA